MKDGNTMKVQPTSDQDSNQPADDADQARDAIQKDRDALQQERDSLFERLARTTAEFQNARRRLESDKEQALAYANSALIKSLLPVIDNFERALATDAGKADPAIILKGMQIVHDQWMKVLKDQFVEVITPQPGEPFNPATMEALIQQVSDKYDPNHVTMLLQNGYSLHGRTLRPAQVAVSKSQE